MAAGSFLTNHARVLRRIAHDPVGFQNSAAGLDLEASNGQAPGPAMLPRVGHATFEVDDLDAVLAAATAAGGTKVWGHAPRRHQGAAWRSSATSTATSSS